MFATGLLVLTAVSVAVWYVWPHPRYNVLLITLDTTRADHLGCYGRAGASTPTIDELSRRGVTFENAYATVPLTLPSHASLLTGLYPPETGVHLNGRHVLPDSIPTLAEGLRDAGYATGAFVAAVVLYGKTGLKRGFDVYDDDMAGGERHGHETHLMRNGRLVVNSALAWLKQNDSRPFFCWIHLFDPHAPFDPHPEIFGDRFRDRPYDGDIAFADRQIGRVIGYLRERGLDERTLIVVVGDHGEGLGEHDEQEHGFLLYNSTLRVPLIVAGPGIQSGHRVPSPVSQVDIMPTVLDCLGLPARPVSGTSFRPALRGEPIPPRVCYSETEACFASYGWAPLSSVTTERWKFVQTTRPELYDLQSDPRELVNLADAQPQQVESLRGLLEETRNRMRALPSSASDSDPQHLRQLRALGYVGGSATRAAVAVGESLPDVKDRIRYYNAEIEARRLIASDPEEAVARLKALTAELPDFIPGWLTLGRALQVAERSDEAIEVYRRALEIDPRAADAHFDLARLYQNRKEAALAEQHYRAVLELDPAEAMAHINLAGILADDGRSDEARRHFEAGVQAFPDSTVGRFNFGLFLYREGEYEAALKHLTRAAELDPRVAQVRYQLGMTWKALNKPSKAAAEFEAALRLNPRYGAAREELEALSVPR